MIKNSIDSTAFKIYSKELNKHSVLSLKREREIKKLMLDPNTTRQEKQQLENEIVQGCLRFVLSTASKFKGTGIEYEDLIAEGNMGLMIAINKFDWTRNNRFITFANQWIRHEILMCIYNNARSIRLPVNIAMQLHKEIKEQNETNKEMSGDMVNLPSTTELNRKIGDDSSLLDVLKNNNAEQTDAQVELESTVNYLLSKLDERSAKILSLIYGINGEQKDMKEIAADMNLNVETIRVIKNKAISKLESKINLTF